MKIVFKELLKASDKKIFEGIIHGFNNSENLYKSAMTLKRKNIFGAANSLYILSFEELITSVVLLIILSSKKEEREQYSFFFNSSNLHKERHEAAIGIKETFEAINIDLLIKNISKYKSEDDFFKKNNKKLNVSYIEKKIEHKKESFYNWFIDANTNKNKGFYIGFNANQWFIPDNLNKGVFQNSIKETKIIRKSLRKILNELISIEENEISDFITHMKKSRTKINL